MYRGLKVGRRPRAWETDLPHAAKIIRFLWYVQLPGRSEEEGGKRQEEEEEEEQLWWLLGWCSQDLQDHLHRNVRHCTTEGTQGLEAQAAVGA